MGCIWSRLYVSHCSFHPHPAPLTAVTPSIKKAKVQPERAEEDNGCVNVGGSGSDLSDEEDDKQDEDMCAKRSTFPERLMELLSNQEAKDAMWWLPSGDSFAIQPKKFSESVLNKYFQGTKLESFTRKMNRWYVKNAMFLRLPLCAK